MRYTKHMIIRYCVIFLVIAVSACGGSKAVKQPAAADWGVQYQKTELTVDQVRATISNQAPALTACFKREKLSSDVLASFVYELTIPNDGTSHQVKQLSATGPNQLILAECIQTVLKKLKFIAHSGSKLRVQVPISGQQLK